MGIAAVIGGAILTGGAGLTGAAAFGAALGRFAIITAASSLLAKRAIPGEPGLSARTLTSRGTVDPEAIIYGTAVVGGTLALRITSGVKNRDFWMVHCLAGHACTGIDDVWLDNNLITAEQINDSDPAGGPVISGPFGPVADRGGSAANIFKQLGSDTQTALPALVSAVGQWTTNHRLRGITYAVTKFTLWDKTEKLWQDNDPQNVKFLVRGKSVYDPRLDTSPGANPDNAAYIAFSDNPALCCVDLLRDSKFSPLIGGVPAARINWDSVVTAANDCDVLVNIPGGTEKRFTCNGVVFGSATAEDNITSMMASMNGNLVFTGGQYSVNAGVYKAPTDSLSEADIVGPIRFESALASTERVNTMKATYIDKEKEYEPTETAAITIQAFKDRDGGVELINSIELPFTDSWYEAQRNVLQRLKEANEEMTIQMPCNLRAARLVPGERVSVTITERNWTNKVFKVLKWELFDRGGDQVGVNVSLREDSPEAYADPAETDYNTLSPGGKLQLASPELVPSVDTIPKEINYGVGTWSIRLRPNEFSDGTPNVGEIGVDPGRFLLPDGSVRTLPTAATAATPFEGPTTPPDDVFYLVWGVQDPNIRFPASNGKFGNTVGFFAAIYDRFNNQWYAVDNFNRQTPFTPLDTDYAVARGTKLTTTGGIDALSAVVPFVTDSVLTGLVVTNLSARAGLSFMTSAASPTTATTELQVRTDGVLYEVNNGSDGQSQGWLSQGSNNDCEVRVTVLSGSLTSGTVGAWEQLNANRVWTKAQTSAGSQAVSIRVEIREIADVSNTTTADYTLTSTQTSNAPIFGALADALISRVTVEPTTATAEVAALTNGTLELRGNSTTTQTWLSSGLNSNAEVFATLLSGPPPTGAATGVWLSMSSARTWTRNQTSVGTSTTELRLLFREIGNPGNSVSADYTLRATQRLPL